MTVELAGDHPGVTDPAYRARRDGLAALASEWKPGEPIPEPDYSEEEHSVWAEVTDALEELHERHACNAYLEGKSKLGLPRDRVPQLTEVGELLRPHSGFE